MKSNRDMTAATISLQTLPPAQAHFCLKIEKICRSKLNIAPGEKILLAISGGADSVALLLVLHILSDRLGIELDAMHINHGLRPNAAKDEAFVAELCHKLGISLKIAKADVAEIARVKSCGVEEAGRLVRYDLLQKQALASNASHILTGHHIGDLAEDILMRLMRGAAWPALGGMAWRNGNIGRPFLHEDPEDLRKLVSACNLKWREDESNQSLTFRRNRIRHIFMPMLRCENPSFNMAASRLHAQAELDAQYWAEETRKALEKNPWQEINQNGEIRLDLGKKLLQSVHPALRMRIFNMALQRLRELGKCPGQNTSDSLAAVNGLYQTHTGNKIIQCAGGIRASYRKGGISLYLARSD